MDPKYLYQEDYPYESSITMTGHKHWEAFSISTHLRYKLSTKSFVVDIGSNVGTLLAAFQKRGVRVLGVEPAENIAKIARDCNVPTMSGFFSTDIAREIADFHGKADVITATNVFAHVDNLDEFINGVKILLRPDGVFILESPYFLRLVQKLEYDTIYHEHLSYLSVRPLLKFFESHSMEIVFVEEQDIHGGSFRVHVMRKGAYHGDSFAVNHFIALEKKFSLHNEQTLAAFEYQVSENRRKLRELLEELLNGGNFIAGIGAPAKGMTLLNYCGIDGDILDFITEKSTLKIGKFTPGQHIPIISDDCLLMGPTEYGPVMRPIGFGLILAWNFASEIMVNLSDFQKMGGMFIVPIPHPRVV